jgi:hypothetical protein
MAVVRRTAAAMPVPRQVRSAEDEPTAFLSPDETTVVGPVPSNDAMAASAPAKPAHFWAIVTGLGLAAAGGGGAFFIRDAMQQPTLEMSSQMSVWASLFVFAAVVERLVEPFTRWLPGRAAQRRYELAVAAMDNGAPGAMAAAARAKADVDRARADRAILAWGLAAGAATAVAAAAGFYLLRMVVADPAWDGIPIWVDALLSGLVVGTGTKPVHDLISRMQHSNERAGDPAS